MPKTGRQLLKVPRYQPLQLTCGKACLSGGRVLHRCVTVGLNWEGISSLRKGLKNGMCYYFSLTWSERNLE